MNVGHQEVCSSEEWFATVRDFMAPWVLGGIELGDDVLEIGPGYGASLTVLKDRVAHVTAVEIDDGLATRLRERFPSDHIDILTGDATALELPSARFSAVVSFSMLHHVPSAERQDRVFAEARRVLAPNGVFAATDGLESEDIRTFHADDTYVPIDPDELPRRLEGAGFAAVEVDVNEFAWKVVAKGS